MAIRRIEIPDRAEWKNTLPVLCKDCIWRSGKVCFFPHCIKK